jgi:hypothetical protein
VVDRGVEVDVDQDIQVIDGDGSDLDHAATKSTTRYS